jgi:V/A-type H+-transporting ATPase subunit K
MTKLLFRRIGLINAVLMGMILPGAVVLAAETAHGGGAPTDTISVYRAIGLGAAAAFAIAISVLGAGAAVGRIGSAALGAAAEKPELLTRSILFVALAEGLAVLGFAIAMMLIQKI